MPTSSSDWSDNLRLLKGQGTYVDDVRLDNGKILVLRVIRSPYSHAKIKRIDISELQRRAVLIFTGEDIAGLSCIPALASSTTTNIVKMPSLARNKVFFVGQPVVSIVAQNSYDAEDLADEISVEYEPLEPVTDPKIALENKVILHENIGTNVCFRELLRGGNIDDCFDEGSVIVEDEFSTHRVSPNPIETRGVIANWDGKRITLWVSCQGVFKIRDDVSEVFSFPRENVHVIQNDVGGAFGCKHALYPEYALASYSSMRLGQPVKWIETRSEHLVATGPGRDVSAILTAAARNNGEILAIKGSILADLGAFTFANNGNYAQFIAKQITGPYRINAAHIEATSVFTNKTPLGAYRGAGRPEASFLYERVIDLVAEKIGMDRAEIRRRNLIRPEEMPYLTPLGLNFEFENYPQIFSKALDFFQYEKKRNFVKEMNQFSNGKKFGLGISTYFELSRANAGETALLRLMPNGRLLLISGIGPHGQSQRDVLRKLVSDEFGISQDRIDVVYGDSDLLPGGYGSFGSRSTIAGGLAALEACRGLKEVILSLVSQSSKIDLQELKLENGEIRAANGSIVTDLNELSRNTNPDLIEKLSSLKSKDIFSFGAHMALVQMDNETGNIQVLEYKAVDDVGRVMSLPSVEGQIAGGIVQGLGEVFTEEMAYSNDGIPLVGDIGNAGVPTAVESYFDIDSLVLEMPSTMPHHVRGVGESGTIGSVPALVAAAEHALNARVRKTLLKPELVFYRVV